MTEGQLRDEQAELLRSIKTRYDRFATITERILAVIAGLLVVVGAVTAILWFQNNKRVDDIATATHANCDVVAVLLENRANTPQTIKLFDPIRQQNPEQFDKLVERARQGDKRLSKAQAALACNIGPTR